MSQGFTDTIMLIRPASFDYNVQTARTNAFQVAVDAEHDELQQKVLKEFDAFASSLRAAGIKVEVFEDTVEPTKPDATFPNNWISFHEEGTVITYPMFAPNRRSEVRTDIVESMKEKYGFDREVDFTHYANARIFLEGTGSMVLDRENKICYACLSQRTDERLLNEFCELMKYDPVAFDAVDKNGQEIYHTNVMMALGPDYAVLCVESIEDKDERRGLIKTLANSGKEIIPITSSQMVAYAGNMLHVRNTKGEDILVMSKRAYNILIDSQIEKLESRAKLLPVEIPTIETVGGGSVRCMMAEVFYP